MSEATTIGVGPYSTIVMPTVGIGPPGIPGAPGPPGDSQVSFGGEESFPNLDPIRFVGVLSHVGHPQAADGTFAANDVCWDPGGQQWLCVAGGTPGTWVAVGSGKVLGSVRIASQYTMSSPGTTEDITGAFFSFVYDGRPIFFGVTPLCTGISPAGASKLINLIVRRSSDSAVVGNSYREQETNLAGQIQPHPLLAGPFQAWPSDAVPFVVGTTYQVKLSISAGAGVSASTNGATQPYTFYAVTA